MKVGELVELSAAGRQLQWLQKYAGKFGIVIKDDWSHDNLYIIFSRPDGRQIKRVLPRKAFRKAKVNK